MQKPLWSHCHCQCANSN